MKPNLKWTIITGAILTLGGPMVGVTGTVLGMMASFQTLGQSGVAKPADLASHMSLTLISTFIGLALGFVGLLVLLAALVIWLSNRSKPVHPPLDA